VRTCAAFLARPGRVAAWALAGLAGAARVDFFGAGVLGAVVLPAGAALVAVFDVVLGAALRVVVGLARAAVLRAVTAVSSEKRTILRRKNRPKNRFYRSRGTNSRPDWKILQRTVHGGIYQNLTAV
jgi:hypothetical protein